MVIVEYLKRDRQGFLPGSRRELIKGAAIDLERRGIAKIVEDKKKPKPKKAKRVNTLDTDQEDGPSGSPG